MRLSLVPRERRFYDLFKQQGRLVSDSLTELSKSLLEGRSRHPRLRDLEHSGDDTTSRIYELVNRTFVTPIDREDILLLASRLDACRWPGRSSGAGRPGTSREARLRSWSRSPSTEIVLDRSRS